MRVHVLVISCTAACWLPHSATSQVTLRLPSQPQWISEEEHFGPASAVTVGGGRLLLCVPAEKSVYLLDRQGKRLRMVGREGSGPGEYRLPHKLIEGRHQTAWIVDIGLRRVLQVDSSGQVGAIARNAGRLGMGLMYLRGALNDGRLVYQELRSPDASAVPSRVVIMSWDPLRDVTAKIGELKPASWTHVRRKGARAPARGVQSIPYTQTEDWAAAPSGGLRFLRAGGSYVETVREDGRTARGRSIRLPPGPLVSQRDRAMMPEVEMPSRKLAFVPGTLLVDEVGRLWFGSFSEEGSSVSLWYVVGRDGALQLHLPLSTDRRILAVSKGGVFVERIVEDSYVVEYYPLPRDTSASR